MRFVITVPQQGVDYVRVTFPAATAALPEIDYNLEVVDIFPPLPKISGDPRFDGFRRDWLNIYQLNPRARVLANHAASDPVAFTVFFIPRWPSIRHPWRRASQRWIWFAKPWTVI